LKQEEQQIEQIYQDIVQKTHQTDPSLEGMVRAELQKNLKSLKNIENRLIKAEKQKEAVRIDQIRSVKDKLFPGNSLQERTENLIYAYMLLGDGLIPELLRNLDPFSKEFAVLIHE
ncbi:MAG: bacillithiol biosynthesis BshC, partial [Flavobacteriales bacterium]|nr:bacillithiol biosynthesis BshC [Flavobacteriales bacterium]